MAHQNYCRAMQGITLAPRNKHSPSADPSGQIPQLFCDAKDQKVKRKMSINAMLKASGMRKQPSKMVPEQIKNHRITQIGKDP